MAFLSNAVERATSALESAEGRLAGFEAELAVKAKALEGDLDFEASLAIREDMAALERKVAAARDAREQQRRNLEAAKKAEAEAAVDAQAKAAERNAREAAKLALEIGDDAQRIAAKLNRLNELNASVDAFNAVRGTRPFIKDGEARAREVPEKVHPTVYEEMDVWRDASGRTPTEFRVLPNGDHVPKDGGYTKHREKFVSRNEWTTPAHFPGGRFKEAMRLVGAKGEKLFPAR